MYPILINFGPFELSSLWFFSTIGFLIAIKIFLIITQKRKLKINIFFEHPFLFILVPFITARFFGVIINSSKFENLSSSTLLELFYLWDKSFSFWIALLSFSILFVFYSKKNNENILPWLDTMSIPFLITMIFINIGKYLDGSGYGSPTNLPWSITFENIQVQYTVPIHPTQIYELIYTIIIMIAVIHCSKKYHIFEKAGLLGYFTIFSYSFFRFFEEFFRGDNVLMFGPIRIPQIICIISMTLVAMIVFKKSKKQFKLW